MLQQDWLPQSSGAIFMVASTVPPVTTAEMIMSMAGDARLCVCVMKPKATSGAKQPSSAMASTNESVRAELRTCSCTTSKQQTRRQHRKCGQAEASFRPVSTPRHIQY